MRCLARLTDWRKTKTRIGDRSVSIVKLCERDVDEGEILCKHCLERPPDGNNQSRMIHGLLTEPPSKESRVYGSEWYLDTVAKYGEPDPEWLALAVNAQKKAEAVKGSWIQVQRLSADIDEMPLPKNIKGTLLEKFAPIKVIYEESKKKPDTIMTDSCSIRKSVVDGMDIWISENGLVFDCDTTGDPGEYIGKMINGELKEG